MLKCDILIYEYKLLKKIFAINWWKGRSAYDFYVRLRIEQNRN